MMLPFESLSESHREAGLVVGTLIGFGFGFVLERAGFGRAQKLAAQFYGTDLTVLKVMFGAIVTAMLGVVVLSAVGLVDFGQVAYTVASGTYVWPMIVGGFALGVGFIVSGYCPGTSFVAAASGKLDGLVVVIGVILGQLVYTELEWRQPLAAFHNSGDLGHRYLWELFGLSPRVGPPIVALAVAVFAVAAFFAAELIERLRSANADPVAQPTAAGVRGRAVFASFGAAAVVGLAALAIPVRTEAVQRQPLTIAPLELARRVLEEPWRTRVIDVRAMDACVAARVPGSECVPVEKLAALQLGDVQAPRDLVLIAEADVSTVPAAAAVYPGRVFALAGGFPAWRQAALSPPRPPAPDASPAERESYRLRAGLHGAMTGVKAAPPPPTPTATPGAAPKKGGGGCSG